MDEGAPLIFLSRPGLDFEFFIVYASFGGEADEENILFKGSHLYAEKVVVENTAKTW